MTEFSKRKSPRAGAGSALQSRSSRRPVPKSLSLALASAFSSAANRAAQAISLTGLSLTLAGLFAMQSGSQAQSQPIGPAHSAANLPQGGIAVHGSATINRAGNTLNVNTTNGAGTNNSIINWQSFNIGAGHTTNINQPSANSSSINRVVTNAPTQIHGTLRSNGNVILVNQNGIAVGAGGVVDTAGFTASTLNISDTDAKAGRLRFEGNALSGGISADGVIRSRNGDVVLIAPQIATGGNALVKADNGNVILGAGQSVEVVGRGLEGMRFIVQSADNKVINLGTLQGNAVGVFAGTLRHSGSIQAQTAAMEGGKVVLRAIKDIEIVRDASLPNAPKINADGGFSPNGISPSGISPSGNSAGAAQSGGNIRIESAQGNITIGAGSAISANAANPAQNLSQNSPVSGVFPPGGAIQIIATEGRVVAEAGSVISATGYPGGTIRILGGQESRIASLVNASSPSLGAADASSSLQPLTLSNIGGTIQILSPGDVALLTGAELLASGDTGGGTILIGGDYQGANAAIPNAQNTNISQGVLLEASARVKGDGGKIIAWANNSNYFGGNLIAKGGEDGGNGGFGETSGKNNLYFRGRADLSARRGRTGTLLLDPDNITITGGAGASSINIASNGGSNGIVSAFDAPTDVATIYEANLELLGATTNVVLEARKRIDFAGKFTDNDLTIAGGLTLRTTNEAASTLSGVHFEGMDFAIGKQFTIRAGGDILIEAGTKWLGGTTPEIGSTNIGGSTGEKLALVSTGGNITMKSAGFVSLGNGTSATAQLGNISVSAGHDFGVVLPTGGPVSVTGGVQFNGISSTQGVEIVAKNVSISASAGNAILMNKNTKITSTDTSAGEFGLQLIADELVVAPSIGVSLTSGNGILVAPRSASRTIVIGSASASGGLAISEGFIGATANSTTTRLQIGQDANSSIILSGQDPTPTPINFGDRQITLATGAGGNISTGQAVAGSPNFHFDFSSAGSLNVRTATGAIDLSNPNNVISNFRAKTNGGDIKVFSGSPTIDLTIGSIESTGKSNISIAAGTQNVRLITGTGAGTGITTLGGDIVIAAPQGSLLIDSDSSGGVVSLEINSSNTATGGVAGSITLPRVAALQTGNSLNVIAKSNTPNAPTTAISLSDISEFGGATKRLAALTINSQNIGATNLDGKINLPAKIDIGGSDLSINGSAFLSQATTITNEDTLGDVEFAGELQGNQNLTIKANANIIFAGTVGANASGNGGGVALQSLTAVSTAGAITLAKNVTVTQNAATGEAGLKLSANSITVGAAATVTASSDDIDISGTSSVAINGTLRAGGIATSSDGNISIASNLGTIVMGKDSLIEGFALGGQGSRKIVLTAATGIVANKIGGAIDKSNPTVYNVVIDSSAAGKSITTASAANDNFSNLLNLQIGSVAAPIDAGETNTPLKVANLSGKLTAFGSTLINIQGTAGNLATGDLRLNGSSGKENIQIETLSGDLTLGGDVVFQNGGSLNIFSGGKLTLGAGAVINELPSVLSDARFVANTEFSINAGKFATDSKGISTMRFEASDKKNLIFNAIGATAAGVAIKYSDLNANLPANIGHLFFGRTDLNGGGIEFSGGPALSLGTTDISFYAGTEMSAVLGVNITGKSVGFRANDAINLSNAVVNTNTIAAKSVTASVGLLTSNLTGNDLAIGSVGPAGFEINGISAGGAKGDVSLTYSGNKDINITKDVTTNGVVRINSPNSAGAIIVDKGAKVSGNGATTAEAGVQLWASDVTISGSIDANGSAVVLLPSANGTRDARLGVGADAGTTPTSFTLTNADLGNISNYSKLELGNASLRFREALFTGNVTLPLKSGLTLFTGGAAANNNVRQETGAIITVGDLRIDAAKGGIALDGSSHLVNSFSAVTSDAGGVIAFKNGQDLEVGGQGIIATGQGSAISLTTSAGSILNTNAVSIVGNDGGTIALNAAAGIGSATKAVLITEPGGGNVTLNLQLGTGDAYVASRATTTSLSTLSDNGTNNKITVGGPGTLALSSSGIVGNDDLFLTSSFGFDFGLASIQGRSLELTTLNGAITRNALGPVNQVDVTGSANLQAKGNIGTATERVGIKANNIGLSVGDLISPSNQTKTIFIEVAPAVGTVFSSNQLTIVADDVLSANVLLAPNVDLLINSNTGSTQYGTTFSTQVGNITIDAKSDPVALNGNIVFNVPNGKVMSIAGGLVEINGVIAVSNGTTSISKNAEVSVVGVLNAKEGLINDGKLSLNAGTVSVGLASGAELINSADATISGAGTLNANVRNRGVIQTGRPGFLNDINVVGDFVQESTGILIISVESATNSRKLLVGGKATLDGTAELRPSSGTTVPAGTYVVIDGASAIGGRGLAVAPLSGNTFAPIGAVQNTDPNKLNYVISAANNTPINQWRGTANGSGGFTGVGDWSVGANWSTGFAPLVGEIINIDVANVAGLVNVSNTVNLSNYNLNNFNLLGDDTIFITGGGNLTLPTNSSKLNLQGTINLAGGTLTGNGAVGTTGVINKLVWAAGTFAGTGQYTTPVPIDMSGVGGGTRVLNGPALSSTGGLTIGSGSLSLLAGKLDLGVGNQLVINSGASLAFDGGSQSGVINNAGKVFINKTQFGLNVAPTQAGQFIIGGGQNLQFTNSNVTLNAVDAVTGGTFDIGIGQTITANQSLNRGKDAKDTNTSILGTLQVNGDFTANGLSFNGGGKLNGNATTGSEVSVLLTYSDTKEAGLGTGINSVSIIQANGDLNINSDIQATNSITLAASGGKFQTLGVNGLSTKEISVFAAGDVDLRSASTSSTTILAESKTGQIEVSALGPLVLNDISTAAGKTALIQATGDVTQNAAITTNGKLEFAMNSKNLTLNNLANVFGKDILIVKGGNVELATNANSLLAVGGDMVSLQAIATGAEVSLGNAASGLTVTNPGLGLTVNAGSISQGGALNISGRSNLTALTKGIALTTASNYGGEVQIISNLDAEINSNSKLVLGQVSAPNLSITSAGDIGQTAAINVGGSTTVNAAGQNILLSASGNQINKFNATGQNVSLASNLDVDLNIAAKGNVLINALSINQTAGRAISAANFSAAVINGINLPGENKLGAVSSSSAAGDIVINDVGGSLVLNNLTAFSNDIFITSTGALAIGGGANAVLVSGGGSVLLDARNITIGSATGAKPSAVRSGGSLTINSGIDLTLSAGNAAGAYASVDAAGAVNVSVAGVVNVTGGSGNGAYALLDPTSSTSLDVRAGSGVNLTGGSGAGAYAAIVSEGNIAFNAPFLSLVAGSGVDADGVVVSNTGVITTPVNCNGCVILSALPLGNGITNQGLFSQSTVPPPPPPPPPPAPAPSPALTPVASTVDGDLGQIAAVVVAVQQDPDASVDPQPAATEETVACP